MSTERLSAGIDLEDLAHLFADAPIPTAIIEIPSTRFLRVNEALTRLLGYCAAELRALRPIDITHDDDRLARTSLPHSGEHTVQKRFLTKHGDIVHANVAFTVLEPETGDGSAYGVAQFIDTSTEVIARSVAEQHQQLLHTLFKDAIVPMSLTIRRSEPFLDVNDAFCRLLGYEREELLMMCPADLGPSGEVDRVTERLAAAVGSGESRLTVDRRFETKDGRILDTMMNVAWTDATPRTYAWQLIDVTELNLERRARVQSEAMFHTAVETAPIGIGVVTSGGRFGLINAELAAMMSSEPSHLMGESVAARGSGPLGTALATGFHVVTQNAGAPYRDSLRFVQGFETIHADITMCAVPSADDEIHHVVVLVVDTTDSRNLVEQLEEIARSKDAFIASATQELRSPMSVILGLVSELRTRLDSLSGHERDQLIDILSDQAEEMVDVVEDLLTAGRTDDGSLSLAPEVVSVPELVDRLVATIAPDHGSITVEVADVAVIADPLRLRQILRNLIGNAVRHGGPHIWIRTEGQTREAELVIVVEDDGAGLPPGEWEDIFLPYHRASAGGDHPGGVGLGLTVARRLTEAMGGSISYACRDGRSRFTLRIPHTGTT